MQYLLSIWNTNQIIPGNVGACIRYRDMYSLAQSFNKKEQGKVNTLHHFLASGIVMRVFFLRSVSRFSCNGMLAFCSFTRRGILDGGWADSSLFLTCSDEAGDARMMASIASQHRWRYFWEVIEAARKLHACMVYPRLSQHDHVFVLAILVKDQSNQRSDLHQLLTTFDWFCGVKLFEHIDSDIKNFTAWNNLLKIPNFFSVLNI